MERDGLVLVALDRRKDDDSQRSLAAWSTAHGGMDPGSHLREAGVPISFWDAWGTRSSRAATDEPASNPREHGGAQRNLPSRPAYNRKD